MPATWRMSPGFEPSNDAAGIVIAMAVAPKKTKKNPWKLNRPIKDAKGDTDSTYKFAALSQPTYEQYVRESRKLISADSRPAATPKFKLSNLFDTAERRKHWLLYYS